MVLTLWI